MSSLSQVQKVSAQESTYIETPGSEWENGNRAVFGGWTMYTALKAGLLHFQRTSQSDAIASEAEERPQCEMLDFKFIRPGKVGVPIEFSMQTDADGFVSVIGVDEADDAIVGAKFRFDADVLDYAEDDLNKVMEIMSLADMAGGSYANTRYAVPGYEVCVTGEISRLALDNVQGYESRMPDGVFDLKTFRALRQSTNRYTGNIGDDRYSAGNEQIFPSGKAVSVNVSCKDEGVRYLDSQMVFVNTDRMTRKAAVITRNRDETIGAYGNWLDH